MSISVKVFLYSCLMTYVCDIHHSLDCKLVDTSGKKTNDLPKITGRAAVGWNETMRSGLRFLGHLPLNRNEIARHLSRNDCSVILKMKYKALLFVSAVYLPPIGPRALPAGAEMKAGRCESRYHELRRSGPAKVAGPAGLDQKARCWEEMQRRLRIRSNQVHIFPNGRIAELKTDFPNIKTEMRWS